MEAQCNILSFGKKEVNLEKTLSSLTIGSQYTSFEKHIQKGNIVLLHFEGKVRVIAKVESDYFFSEDEIWSDRIYPHRFKISVTKKLNTPVDFQSIGFNKIMRDNFGRGWAFTYIFSPKPLPKVATDFLIPKLT